MTNMPGKSTREQCWDHVIYSFGTGFIFETRAKRLRRALRWLTFLGIAVPVAIGAIVLTFGTKSDALPFLLIAAGILAVAQLVLSVWSLVAAWNDNLAYSVESARSNYRLVARYEDLGRNAPADIDVRFNILEAERQAREDQDIARDLTEKEKRMGLRTGLRKLQRACVSCKNVPMDMKSSDCPVCGQF